MKVHGTIQTSYGPAQVLLKQYVCGELAVVLETEDGPLAKLSVWIAEKSIQLPPNQFYVKTWSENEQIVADALASGLFKVIDPVGVATGWVTVPLWELIKENRND